MDKHFKNMLMDSQEEGRRLSAFLVQHADAALAKAVHGDCGDEGGNDVPRIKYRFARYPAITAFWKWAPVAPSNSRPAGAGRAPEAETQA